MSLTALEAMGTQMTSAVEESPSSETFTIDPDGTPSTFKGIFDNSNIAENEDEGGIERKNRVARIMVAEIPAGLTADVVIARENGARFNYSPSAPALDDEGLEMIWLY